MKVLRIYCSAMLHAYINRFCDCECVGIIGRHMVIITTQPQATNASGGPSTGKFPTLLTSGSVAFIDPEFKRNQTVPHIRSGTGASNGNTPKKFVDYPPVGVVLSSNSERSVGRNVPTTMGVQTAGVCSFAAQHEQGTNISLGKLILMEWPQQGTNCGRPPQIDQNDWFGWVPKPMPPTFNDQSLTVMGVSKLREAEITADQITEVQNHWSIAGRYGVGSWKSLGIHRHCVGKGLVQCSSMPVLGDMTVA